MNTSNAIFFDSVHQTTPCCSYAGFVPASDLPTTVDRACESNDRLRARLTRLGIPVTVIEDAIADTTRMLRSGRIFNTAKPGIRSIESVGDALSLRFWSTDYFEHQVTRTTIRSTAGLEIVQRARTCLRTGRTGDLHELWPIFTSFGVNVVLQAIDGRWLVALRHGDLNEARKSAIHVSANEGVDDADFSPEGELVLEDVAIRAIHEELGLKPMDIKMLGYAGTFCDAVTLQHGALFAATTNLAPNEVLARWRRSADGVHEAADLLPMTLEEIPVEAAERGATSYALDAFERARAFMGQ